jgi:hypothetical protein
LRDHSARVRELNIRSRMDEHSNDTGGLGPEAPRGGDRIKLILIPGGGSPTVDPGWDAGNQTLMDGLKHDYERRRRGRRLIAYILSAASAVLGYFAMLRFLSR